MRPDDVDVDARRWAAPLLVLALGLALVAAPAAAQALLAPAIDLELQQPRLALAPGEQAVVEARVTNSGGVDGDVTVAVQPPAGWTARVEPTTFPLAAGAARTVRVTVTAAAEPPAAADAAVAPLAVAVELTDAAGRTVGDEASLGLAFVLPAPVPPPSRTPLYAGVAAGAVLLVGLAGGGVAVRRRRRLAREAAEKAAWNARETGVTVQVAGLPRPLGDKRELYVRVVVRNVSDKPRVALVGIEPPEGWTGSVQLPRLALSPGESQGVAAHFRPGPGVEVGARADAVVWTKPEEARERDERVTFELVAPVPRTPAFQARGLN